MDEESVCIISTTNRCVSVTKKYEDSLYAAERVVVKPVANLDDLEEGESLFLIRDDSTEKTTFGDAFYKYLTLVVYVLSIVVIIFCFLSDFIVE